MNHINQGNRIIINEATLQERVPIQVGLENSQVPIFFETYTTKDAYVLYVERGQTRVVVITYPQPEESGNPHAVRVFGLHLPVLGSEQRVDYFGRTVPTKFGRDIELFILGVTKNVPPVTIPCGRFESLGKDLCDLVEQDIRLGNR